ncbi:MAG TPA: TraR/DksA C4-type zinc finger protein [Actinomycetota bacterium]|nr:TraR/DksA C4-type zinc finger protein [Actinomycetota bacterium]
MDESKARRLLEEERTRLEQVRNTLLLESLEESQSASMQELADIDQHPGDQGTETFEREKAESIRISTEAQLQDVDRAVGKLDSGQYGRCEICGRDIPDERLEARPAARYCIEDQAKVEQESAGLP